jgi:hypothetical protein
VPPVPLEEALALEVGPDAVVGRVAEGYDVFGIPHGGYLAALAAKAALARAGLPDLFSVTTHFLRKAAVGPIRFEVEAAGQSRRFRALRASGRQDGQVVLALSALVGDRETIDGPSWEGSAGWDHRSAPLTPPAGAPDAGLPTPAVAERLGLRLDLDTLGFTRGEAAREARVRGTVRATPVDQLLALIACDITPPAVWNVLGPSGWVPTVELTAHIRARPAEGPLGIDVATAHVGGGFLEEDAVVRDDRGALVAQSRQLARYSESPAR